MKTEIIENVSFLAVEYKSTSTAGNISYKVTFEDSKGQIFKASTARNISDAIDVKNCHLLKRKANITIHKTRKGNILIDFCTMV